MHRGSEQTEIDWRESVERVIDMGADEIRKYLSEKYGIKSDEQLLDMIRNSQGLDIGIFTMPIGGQNDEKKAS